MQPVRAADRRLRLQHSPGVCLKKPPECRSMCQVTGQARDGGGAEGNRTPDLLIANEALSQLSYSPIPRAATASVARGRRRARTMLICPIEVKRGPMVFLAQGGFALPCAIRQTEDIAGRVPGS